MTSLTNFPRVRERVSTCPVSGRGSANHRPGDRLRLLGSHGQLALSWGKCSNCQPMIDEFLLMSIELAKSGNPKQGDASRLDLFEMLSAHRLSVGHKQVNSLWL